MMPSSEISESFALLPACLERVALTVEEKVEYLHIEVPSSA
jgi:hypothetical protein